MIRKTVQKHKMSEYNEIRQNLEYWLSRPPEERIEAIEILRRQFYGDKYPEHIQKFGRVIKRLESGEEQLVKIIHFPFN
jgi:hypothetical protein